MILAPVWHDDCSVTWSSQVNDARFIDSGWSNEISGYTKSDRPPFQNPFVGTWIWFFEWRCIISVTVLPFQYCSREGKSSSDSWPLVDEYGNSHMRDTSLLLNRTSFPMERWKDAVIGPEIQSLSSKFLARWTWWKALFSSWSLIQEDDVRVWSSERVCKHY